MATLYKLTDEYTDLLARLEAAEDDAETEAVWQEMDALEDDIVEKAEAYAPIMRNKQAEVEAFKAEKERLASCQKAAENVVRTAEGAAAVQHAAYEPNGHSDRHWQVARSDESL